MYKAIIFDFFGVIQVDRYKAWLNNHGYRLEGDYLDAIQKIDKGITDLNEFYRELSDISGLSVESIQTEMKLDDVADPSIIDLIKNLKKNYKLGLLTNVSGASMRALIKKLDLEQYFNEIMISGEIGIIKPDPRIFEYALKTMKVQASQAVFIDDSETNIMAAQNVGIQAIQYFDLKSLKQQLSKLGVKY